VKFQRRWARLEASTALLVQAAVFAAAQRLLQRFLAAVLGGSRVARAGFSPVEFVD
jgi:hypothetical protein